MHSGELAPPWQHTPQRQDKRHQRRRSFGLKMLSNTLTLATGLVHSTSSGEGRTKRERNEKRPNFGAEQQNCMLCCGHAGSPHHGLHPVCADCGCPRCVPRGTGRSSSGHGSCAVKELLRALRTREGQTRHQQKTASNQSQ